MKLAGLVTCAMVAMFLIGCENPELVTCQQEKGVLHEQINLANAAIAEKDSKIEALKTENIDMQNKAMESITTMMQKQAKKDEELKKSLADANAELKKVKVQSAEQLAEKEKKINELSSTVADLEKQIAEHTCPVPEAPAAEPAEVQ